MDTSWFALDKCGHVAAFWSGEDGGVPYDAPDLDESSLGRDLPFPGELDRCLREGSIVPGSHTSRPPEGKPPWTHGFFLVGPGVKSKLPALPLPGHNLRPPVLGTTDGREWAGGAVSAEAWTWLHEVPHRCLGCSNSLRMEFDVRAETFGIVRYEHDNYGGRPYDRVFNPIVPATAEQIEKITGRPLDPAPRFKAFCFRDKLKLQPLQWFPCDTYGDPKDRYLDEEGNVQPGPGRKR